MATQEPRSSSSTPFRFTAHWLGQKAKLVEPKKEGKKKFVVVTQEVLLEGNDTLEITEFRDWPIEGCTVNKRGVVAGIPLPFSRFTAVDCSCSTKGAGLYKGQLSLPGEVNKSATAKPLTV